MNLKTAFALLGLVASFAGPFFLDLPWTGIAPLCVHALAVNKQDSGGQITFEYHGDTSELKDNSLRGGVARKNLHGRFLHITDIVSLSLDLHEMSIH
jgi:hypothetical protein